MILSEVLSGPWACYVRNDSVGAGLPGSPFLALPSCDIESFSLVREASWCIVFNSAKIFWASWECNYSLQLEKVLNSRKNCQPLSHWEVGQEAGFQSLPQSPGQQLLVRGAVPCPTASCAPYPCPWPPPPPGSASCLSSHLGYRIWVWGRLYWLRFLQFRAISSTW